MFNSTLMDILLVYWRSTSALLLLLLLLLLLYHYYYYYYYYTFPCNFLVYGEVADLLPTCCGLLAANYLDMSKCRLSPQQVCNKLATNLLYCCNGIGKRHDTADTTDTTDFCLRQLVTDLRQICYTEKLRGNWCNGFWP